jgi:hypothetical protein
VNETKLLGAVGAAELRTMQAEELEQFFNGPAGFLGPSASSRTRKPLGDGSRWSSTSRSKAARTWSPAPTSSTTTCAT